MPRSPSCSCSVILVALGCITAPVFADDVQTGHFGQQIVPVDSDAIRMASERVDVDVCWPKSDTEENTPGSGGQTEMRVRALFVLVNESDKPQSILVSFPGAFGVTDFTRTVDGRPVKVEEHRGAEYGNSSKIDFAPRQTRRVRVEYTGSAAVASGYDYEEWWRYVLTTGSRWKGKIGEAVIAVHFPEDMPLGGRGPFNLDAITMTPTGYKSEGRTATWTFSDFEPSQDIWLTWTRYSALLASDPFRLASKEEASALLLEQGQQLGLRKALGAFAAIREFFPNSIESKTLDYHIASAFEKESRCHQLNLLYAKEAIARYEAALKQPIDAEQREAALCGQFILCCVKTRDNAKARMLLDRLKKEKLESKTAAALTAWGRDRAFCQHPQEALTAFEATRKFFPDSPEAKIVDYRVARVYAKHFADTYTMGKLTFECAVTDARKAVAHYEAALKQPLDPRTRQNAMAELFILYSAEAPDPAKAQQTYDRLKAEKIDPRDYWIVLKVLAVSPAKALGLVDSMSAGPERAKEVLALRARLQRLLKAHPDGVVNRKPTPQT
jgi:hypothetical protein